MKARLLAAVVVLVPVFPSVVAAVHAACASGPAAGCTQTDAHQSSLRFAETVSDPDTIFTWLWKHGPQTAVADFGDPPSGTAYVLCLYDQSARPQPVYAAPANEQAWRAFATGFIYVVRGPHPLRRLVLRAGNEGKTSLFAHGNDETVNAVLPFTAPVRVQLQASNGRCWESTFPTPLRSDAHQFIATD